jgi:ankyrin repeat protein
MNMENFIYIKLLIDNNNSKDALALACENSWHEVVKLLLLSGIIPSNEDYLLSATKNGDTDIIITLLNYGAIPNKKDINGITPISCAVEYNHIDIIDILLINGANPFISDVYGATPLSIANEKGYNNIVDHITKWSLLSLIIILYELSIFDSLDWVTFFDDFNDFI